MREQQTLDFNVPPAEAERRESAKTRVLDRLLKGPASNVELNAICYRYGARLKELRDQGYNIITESVSRGEYRYILQAAQ